MQRIYKTNNIIKLFSYYIIRKIYIHLLSIGITDLQESWVIYDIRIVPDVCKLNIKC